MQMQDVWYHGIRQSLRTVLVALGPERIEKGLTAFDDGESDWSSCFFARAFEGELDFNDSSKGPERAIMDRLNLPSVVPVRNLWTLFDQIPVCIGDHAMGDKPLMKKQDLRRFIEGVLDESRPKEVLDLIRQVDFNKVVKVVC